MPFERSESLLTSRITTRLLRPFALYVRVDTCFSQITYDDIIKLLKKDQGGPARNSHVVRNFWPSDMEQSMRNHNRTTHIRNIQACGCFSLLPIWQLKEKTVPCTLDLPTTGGERIAVTGLIDSQSVARIFTWHRTWAEDTNSLICHDLKISKFLRDRNFDTF